MSGQGVIPIANALATNTTLTYLDLSDNNIGDSGAEFLANALARNTTLTQLVLEFNNISDVMWDLVERRLGDRLRARS